MKNILAYTNPAKNFDPESDLLIKIQIDNSLSLGWKKEDILLTTNFDYEYNGVKAVVVPDEKHYDFDKVSNKIAVIVYLLNNGMLDDNLYWYHDLDAYELNPIEESGLRLDGADCGFTDYGWMTKWNCGSFFFKLGAKDVFNLLHEKINETKIGDERMLGDLTTAGQIDPQRYKRLNITYNLGMRNVGSNYEKADKPVKVLHFHPFYRSRGLPDSTLNIFMYGKNEMGFPLMNERLTGIFNHHGIK